MNMNTLDKEESKILKMDRVFEVFLGKKDVVLEARDVLLGQSPGQGFPMTLEQAFLQASKVVRT